MKATSLLFFLISARVRADPYEDKLYNDLMNNYDPLERPVKNNSLPVVVRLGVILNSIVDVDEKNQIIKLNAWLSYSWKDYKLHWEKEEYGGVTDVRFPAGKIWKPDVLLYNSVDSSFDSTYSSNMIVYNDGSVSWIPPGIFSISCKIDITWFPFDDQSCFIKFGSWTYSGVKLDLQPQTADGLDMTEYLVNGEWNLLSTPVVRSEKFYDCCPEPYPDLKFFLNMRRRTLYYGLNLIVPSLLISLMTILGFTLPVDAGEKIGFEITILLAMCVFLGIVAEMTPPTSEAVPLVGAFFSCCMLFVSISIVSTVLVINLHHRNADMYEMGHFPRTILLHWLPWMLWMSRPGHNFTWKTLPNPLKDPKKFQSESLLRNVRSNEEIAEAVTQPGLHPRLLSVDFEHKIMNCLKIAKVEDNTIAQLIILMMQRILAQIKFITKRMEGEDESKSISNDYIFAAMVIDRLCLILFSVLIISSSAGILFSAPYMIA